MSAVDLERTMSVSWIGLGKELVSDKSLRRRFIISMVAQLGFNFSGGNSVSLPLLSLSRRFQEADFFSPCR